MNFLVWNLTKTLHFVEKGPNLFTKFLGRLRMTLCYWKTFSVPDCLPCVDGRPIFIQCGCWGESCSPYEVARPQPSTGCASMGPEILSSSGAGVWRKAPLACPDSSSQENTPWVASACADCPGFLVLGAAPDPASTWSLSLRLFTCASILLYGPLDICLDLLPAASPPPVQKRDAQHMFLQHRGAHAEVLYWISFSLRMDFPL